MQDIHSKTDKLVILDTAVVWYKRRTWKAKTNGVLNSAGVLNKPLECMPVNMKFSVKRLTSYMSEMKGTEIFFADTF